MKAVIKYFFLLIAGINFLWAQQPSAQALIKIDTNRIRIGEEARLEIIFSYNKNQINKQLQWPAIGDTIRKEIEVTGKTKPEPYNTKNSGSTSQYRQFITITSFDSGYWVIPPFKFYLAGDSVVLAETAPLLLEVQTVATDTAEASVKDIKPIFEEKWDWRAMLPYVWWGLGIAAVLAGIIILTVMLTRKKKIQPPKPVVPLEPPHITALRQLELIRQEKIWKEGKYKEYYTAITDTLRIYIEGRFNINAMELTTDEIVQVFRTQVIDTDSKKKMHQVLSLADFVKFAKATPIEAENELVLNNAFDFVNGTSREETTTQEQQESPSNTTTETHS
jgi:hypothetical protein